MTRTGVAGALLALAAGWIATPAAAQGVTEIKNFAMPTERFPQLTVAWTLAGTTGSFDAPPYYGGSFAIPPGTQVPATIELQLHDPSAGETFCRVEVELTGPLTCTPKPIASPRCVVLMWGTGSDLCTVRVRKED